MRVKDGFRFEQRVALIAAVSVVAFIMYLLYRNDPFQDPNLVVGYRILLSLAAGILGASIPGWLEVTYSVAGLSIRAAGALALFIVTFVGTPQVLPNLLPKAEFELRPVKQVDLRSALGPQYDDEARRGASAYVTIPLLIQSKKEPATKATLQETSLQVESGNRHFEFKWRNFVTMHEERFGLWLGIDGDAQPVSIDPGAAFYREVLHAPVNSIRWEDLLQLFDPDGPSELRVLTRVQISGQKFTDKCVIDLAPWRKEIATFKEKTGSIPGRVTMTCQV